MEIMGRFIIIESRKKEISKTNILKSYIYENIKKGLKEGAIFDNKKNVVGWWKIKNIFTNPLLK